MDSFVCRKATLLVFAASLTTLWAQTTVPLDWRRVGSTVLDLSLASPAGGGVDRVWYAGDGSRLFARTQSGRVWHTSDFESWQRVDSIEVPTRAPALVKAPEEGFAIAHPGRPGRFYAVGRFAYRSDDGGLNWTNLTQDGPTSILGGPLSDAAASPRDPDEIVVAGEHGLWRSLDGGESWSGLNEGFPNFPAQRITRSPGQGASIHVVARGGEFTWNAGERMAWRPSNSSVLAEEQRLITSASASLGMEVSAIASAGDVLYAGTSDGHLFFSRDGGANWSPSGVVDGAGRVHRIRIDAQDPNLAIAVTRSTARARVLRTNTGGVFWEDLTGDLPVAAVRGAALDRASSAIYAATDRGVYFGYAESAAPAWQLLRPEPAYDLALDDEGNQLYVALADSGIFAALAPHRFRDPRVVSAADRMARAAAPGSLLSVIGARVRSATIGERNAPVLASSDLESQIQVPFDTTGTSMRLATATASGRRQVDLPLRSASPSIFVDRDGVALVMSAETGLVLDPSTPASSGERLQILATGLGQVEPAWPTGLAAPLDNAPSVITPVRAYLDREAVQVSRATLAPGYIGMYLIEVQLPSIVNRGTAELYIEAENQQSNRIRIYLEP
jgi:uncharacterized protein (TIGR03437 family)